jgi:hypothetical protein
MSQSLWLFGSRLTIVADHTTTAGQYDLIEEYSLPGSQPFSNEWNLVTTLDMPHYKAFTDEGSIHL